MAQGDVVDHRKCNACGFDKMPVKEGKGGALSGQCPKCKAQLIIRTPAGVQTFREFVEGKATPVVTAVSNPANKSFAATVFGEEDD